MEEWFTVENIDDDTFVISEYKHWEKTYSYLAMGDNRAVLIDTGLGIDNIKRVLPAHFSLDISVEIVSKIEEAFKTIKKQGNLQQGKGIFNYNDFSIHI